ncbi:hypothetical protein [Streptomyces sp. NBC_00829]|uniref:hypothetical protein n=1 Tax=Streptomyces sp. NBC_00829 TaxID=2903679 RepID=UPI00386B5746|nr:hypothetical protein OG293_38855 [Streptomyces sp. NBC_00829]
MALFTRTAPAPETWTPEGATVLVYTGDTDRVSARYAVACLSCTHREDRNASGNVMTETEAAQAANAHATACRAVPRGVPARPRRS